MVYKDHQVCKDQQVHPVPLVSLVRKDQLVYPEQLDPLELLVCKEPLEPLVQLVCKESQEIKE